MGYMTNYTLFYRYSDDAEPDYYLHEEVLVTFLDTVTGYHWDRNFQLFDAKWYDHHDHMLKISTDYPDLIFTLKGEGEEAGDLWKKYYKNGKYQEARAQIVYEEYDESKLKSK
jgi:hypothetical protein